MAISVQLRCVSSALKYIVKKREHEGDDVDEEEKKAHSSCVDVIVAV
jgi:hypothetical protein